MNALVRASIDGEILPPSATVFVFGRINELSGSRVAREVAAGLSILEILRECGVDGYVPGFAVELNGAPIEQKNFHRIRVKAGVTMTFRGHLAGGGNVWATVLSAVVAITALVVALWAAPFVGAALGISAGIAQAFIAVGIMAAGALLSNALFPVRPPAATPASVPLNSIQGAQNQGNPFGVIPVVLGRTLQSPYYAAKPYTELVGDDQYLRVLFCLGYGPQQIDTPQIGQTDINTFQDVTIEIRQGFPGDAPITLYPSAIDEQDVTVTLSDPVDLGGRNGTGGIWNSLTTALETDSISVDFTAPDGINMLNDGNGDDITWPVSVEMQYRLVGAGGFTEGGTVTFTRNYSPSRLGINVAVARGQYEVQCRKLTGDSASITTQGHDTIVWTALRSMKNETPIAFKKPLALVALRIKATDQLSGVVDTFNCITTSLVTAYSGSAWNATTASQNPADLFRWVLQGPANARPQPDSGIDLDTLQDFWTFCDTNKFKFNQVVNSPGSVNSKLCDICSSARAAPTFNNGRWSVIWDLPNSPIVQVFTRRNSWGFKGQKAYVQQPDGFRVQFINELNGFTQDEIRVYDDGFDETNATLFEQISFVGVTDPTLNWRLARFHIAQARLRPETITVNAGWEHLVCTRGDRIALSHDVPLIGLGSGRIKAVAGQVVTLDETITIETGKTYGLQVRVAASTSPLMFAIDVMPAGDYNQVTLVGDLSPISAELAASGNFSKSCLYAFGETDQITAIYRVQGITNQQNLVAALTLVDDAPAISSADQGTIPAYVPNITLPVDPQQLPPRNLVYFEFIDGMGAVARALVRFSWQLPRLGAVASFEFQRRDDNAQGQFGSSAIILPPSMSYDFPLPSAGIWSFRVRCIFSDGTASSWVELDQLTLNGLSSAPLAISNLRNTFIAGRSFLSWDQKSDPRVLLVEVRKGTSFASAQIIDDNAITPWQTVGDDTYFITAYVNSAFGVRIYATSVSIEIAGSIVPDNAIVSHDERAEGWTGNFSGTVGIDTDNNFLRTAGNDNFLGRTDTLGTGNFLDGDGTLQTGGIYWSQHVVDVGGVAFCRVSNNWTATGVPATDDFLGNSDFLGNLDFLKASLSQFVRVRPVIRTSQVGPVPTWSDPQVWSPDVYQARMYQLGMQFEILDPTQAAIAYLLAWSWTIDVPDRTDSYQNLTIPAGTGLPIVFQPTGSSIAVPFNGGVNDEPLPHLVPSIQSPNPGDQVAWSSLTTAGVTLQVMNAGVSVGGSNVNLLVRGY